MNSRERLLTALSRGIPDRVPRDLSWGLSPLFYEKFKEKTGELDYEKYFGIDHRFLSYKPTTRETDFLSYFKERALVDNFYVNEWGIGLTKAKNSELHFEHMIAPLKDAKSVNDIIDFPMPDLMENYRHSHFEEEVKKIHGQGLAVTYECAQTLFEKAWLIRGLEEFMMDMIEEPEMVECLLDKLLDLRVQMVRKGAQADVDVILLGDDVAMQTGMMMSPTQWRQWFKPRMAKIISEAKAIKPDIHIFYHSDGSVEPIVDDLIEIGVTVLNPIQPECVDPAEIKKKFGKKIAFWGAIGVQSNLPFGTPEDVKNEVKLRMETIGKNGGYVIGPTHYIEPEVPWENLVAMFEAIDKYGQYK